MLRFTSDSAILEQNPIGVSHGTAKLSGSLVFPSGVTYRIDNSNVSWIRDRNGNKISLSYSSAPEQWVNWFLWVYAPTAITDSLNRTITINYSDSSCGGCTEHHLSRGARSRPRNKSEQGKSFRGIAAVGLCD